MAVDQDVGDRRVLEQRLERPEAEQLVEDVADQLLALGMVERVVLLGQLLGDDVADFGLDLLARHLVERLQVDEVEQPLVKLDLELGMLVALGERAGVADRDQPMLLERALLLLFARRVGVRPVYGSATCLALQSERGGNAGVEHIEILAERALALDLVDRNAAVDRRAHQREVVADGVGDVAAERLAHVGGRMVRAMALFEAVDDDPDVELAEVLRFEQVELAPARG